MAAYWENSSWRDIYSKKVLLKLFIGHWQWFLLSMMICLCTAYLYTRLTTPIYKITAKLLVKDADVYEYQRYSKTFSSNMQTFGTMSMSEGVANEAEMIWSTQLMGEVVKHLKLYVNYKEEGRIKDRQVYATQPINVDLDSVHQDIMDRLAYEDFRTITMKMVKPSATSDSIIVKGVLRSGRDKVWGFSRQLKSLPATIKTPFGKLTFTRNPEGEEMEAGRYWYVTVNPPLYQTLICLRHFAARPAKRDRSLRTMLRNYYKMSSVINLVYADQNVRRGTDVLNQLAFYYNRQANADKDEKAQCVEDFINQRLVTLSKELGALDVDIVDIKREAKMSSLKDAGNALRQTNNYSRQLMEAATQSLIIDDLKKYIADPAHRNSLIPSSIGLMDKESVKLIGKYNILVQQRNRILMSASEDAVMVKQLNTNIAEMRASVITALQHAKEAADIICKGIESQYSDYKGRVAGIPNVERALKEAGRERRVKSWLYRLLLQRREENSIEQSSTADRGTLIDAPQCDERLRPRLWLVYSIAVGLGLGGPYAVLIALGLFRYRLESLEELKKLTELPIIAGVPIAGENEKGKAGIVVHYGTNTPIDEVYRMMRTNLFFMLTEGRHVILFTSSTSGEGKSFNSANLAVSYALLGKRVILCGLDIRKPSVGKQFGMAEPKRGITSLLAMDVVNKEDVERIVVPSGVEEHLDLLMAGSVPPNPTELLAHDSLRQVIDILKESYDYVILDTAPVGLVTDTLQISKLVDVTVYVCRLNYTPKFAIAELNGLTEEKMLTNPCIVLNGCPLAESKEGGIAEKIY